MKNISEMIILMKTRISSERRQEIKQIVLSALRHLPNTSLPVRIKAICKSYSNIRLIPYSLHMKRYNLSYEDMKIYCETSDSCADYYANQDKYIIYYNDIDYHNIINSNRYRWNIAHELGHVLLKHHKTNNNTRIFRYSLTHSEYTYFEEEADYFAQLILVPHVVLYAFKIQNERILKMLCKISDPTAKIRFRAYKDWRQNINENDPYDKPLFFHYYDYLFKRRCVTCNAGLVQHNGKYCPICGNKTLQWGDGPMIYPKLVTYENGKLTECPTCKNEETNIEGNHCQICGNNLVNFCSFNNCSNFDPLPSNARYCPVCGSRSTFLDKGFLNEWNYKEQGFIDIPDGMDEELPFN